MEQHPVKAHPRKKGSALIIVLSCLVFISIMILAFFASVSTEHQSAVSYANSSSAKLLADSTVDIVIGQIKDATKGIDPSNSNSSTNTLAWASQPGMIRTYNQSGQPAGYFKLYSWDGMVGTGTFNPAAPAEKPPTSWKDSPALYTDLNDPVSGKYPIVDPSAVGVVQGFSITNAPVSATNTAPMPVQWLYILQDGKLATATGSASTANVPLATDTNPIVGRIAFWTDDDSSKVNINTAAGDIWPTTNAPAASTAANLTGNPGSFWDTPRDYSSFEKTYFAKYQPAKDEYQRFPGHPATTYLSAVFPTLTAAEIYNISPRVALGGSQSGTVVPTVPVPIDGNRLYATVDEILFAPGITPIPGSPPDPRPTNPSITPASVEKSKFFLTAHSRAPEVNLRNQPRVIIWPISATTGTSGRTAYDSLIAACGTLNNNPYYFQRSSSTSQTTDLPNTASPTGLGRNRSLISYLRNLTSKPIPGFSTSSSDTFLNKYPKDRDQIFTEIFDYIRTLNAQDTSVSGLTPFTVVSASTAGTTGQGQVVPIIDNMHSDSNSSDTLRGFGRFPTVREATLLFAGVGQTKGALKSVPPVANQLPGTAIADKMTRVQAVFILNFFDPSQGYGACVPDFKVRVSQLNGFTWLGAPMGFPATGTVTLNKNYNTGLYGGYKGASSFIHGSGYSTACTSGIKDMPTNNLPDPVSGIPVPTSFAFTGGDVKVEILDSAGATVLQTLTINFKAATFPVPDLGPLLRDPGVPTPAYNVDYRNLSVPTGLSGALTVQPRFAGSGTNTGGSTSTKMWACGKDVMRSVVANTDCRLIAAKAVVPSSFFSSIEPQYSDTTVKQIHSIAEAQNGGGCYSFIGAMFGKFVANADYATPEGAGAPAPIPAGHSDLIYTGVEADGLQPTAGPVAGSPTGLYAYSSPLGFGMKGANCVPLNGVAAGVNDTDSASLSSKAPGDWDTGMSLIGDGAFINKADEGNISNLSSGSIAYYEGLGIFTSTGGTFFSPNRQIASAVMFGSLPTGVVSNKPWQTLLFRPDPGGTPQHLGAQSPPDHLILDLFTMPVVEPYAISDPFSTAGKINMNYQIVPFTYITRNTGLQAVLKPEQILALKNADTATYKTSATFANRRNFLDINETLKGFDNRFATGDIFRSASEICNIWLVPQGETYAGMTAFWSNNQLTGDNVREKPYANIYPRLTTKSNTYTVHYRVQTLKKIKSNTPTQWVEGRDQITGEYRGSSVLERYLDTSDTRIPDYATATNPASIDTFYKFRVIETMQFTP